MPSNIITNSENLISELNKHNIKIFGDIEKFLKTYSAANDGKNSFSRKEVDDDRNDKNEEYIEELIEICHLNDRYKTDAEREEEEVVEETEISSEVAEEEVHEDKIVEEEVIKEKCSFETSHQNAINPGGKSDDLIKVNKLDDSDTSGTCSKSSVLYLDCSSKADEVNNKIPNNSKTGHAMSVLLRVAHKLYHLFTPTSNFSSEDAVDTTTTFMNKNFMETDESIQENIDTVETSTVTLNEITTQTPKQRDYYFESLEQILYDPFTSITHKSYCLKHGRRGNMNKYPRIGKDSCYEKAANIGNAIKKFEILIQEEQKEEFRFKSETMRRTAQFQRKGKNENF